MKIALVFGAQGQLGHALSKTLRAQGHTVHALGRADVDATDYTAVLAALQRIKPDWVFNGTAYNAVDQAEEERDAALLLNAMVPGHMAAACGEVGARFMHFSTDYVFGAGFTQPIDESEHAQPISAYGKSKRLGEQLAMQNNADTLVVRCCGLYSERRNNFVRTMLKHGLAGRRLTVVHDQMISPTWVKPLASVCVDLMHTPVRGIYHAVSHGECSWFAYAKKVFEVLDIKADIWPINQAEWGAAAPRAAYSVLDNAMLRALNLDAFMPWDEALEAFLKEHGAALVAEFS